MLSTVSTTRESQVLEHFEGVSASPYSPLFSPCPSPTAAVSFHTSDAGCRGFPGGNGGSARIRAVFHGDGRCPPFRVSGCDLACCLHCCRRACRTHRRGGSGQRLCREGSGGEGALNFYSFIAYFFVFALT